MFDPGGHFSAIFTRSDLPKFDSNNRQAGTPEENKAVVQGSIAVFGMYSVNGTDNIINFHIEGSTFPNWNWHRSETSRQTFRGRTELDRSYSVRWFWSCSHGL